MCVILMCRSKKPTREIIEKCNSANSDGIGVAWLGKENSRYAKGLNVEKTMKIIDSLPLPFVIHFRASSCGGKDPLLTHPFEISEKSELKLTGASKKLLIHNGHFSDWKICLSAAGFDIPKTKSIYNENLMVDESMSDTRAIAMIISRNNNESFLSKINGKFVVIDSIKRKMRYYGDFTEEDGIWYSNMTWKWKNTTKSYYGGHYAAFSSGYYDGHPNYHPRSEVSNLSSSSQSKEQRKADWEAIYGNKSQPESVNESEQKPDDEMSHITGL